MSANSVNLKKMFSFKRVFIPILIGIGFSAFSLLYNDFDFSLLKGLKVSFFYIILAVLLMMVRDLAYIWRLQVLTDSAMKFKDAFHVIMLWEFASSVTPSMVGGSAFAIFFIKAEGIKLGKSTAIVLITALLDELFYIVMAAIILLYLGTAIIPESAAIPFNLKLFFGIGYGFIILLTSIILVGVLFVPRGTKQLLVALFSLPILKKWKEDAAQTGDEIIITSKELKGKSFGFWVKSSFATVFSWTARYLVLNCLILALNPGMEVHINQQLLIFAKQLVMWIIMLISPTPGASGVAEFSFSAFFGNEFSHNIQDAVALLWRAISYYPYLFIGLVILPIWLRKLNIRRKLNNRKSVKNENETECKH